jgi:hypothetical protein
LDAANNVETGDLNGDGFPDMAVANYSAASLSVFLSTNSGAYGPKIVLQLGQNVYPSFVAIADMNNDGKADLASANSGSVSILLNTGAGAFSNPANFTTAGYSATIAIGDVNRDGNLDVVVPTYQGTPNNSVGVLLGDGAGSLAAPVYYPTGPQPVDAKLADLDLDGNLDIVTANYGGVCTVSVLRGTAAGTFLPKTDYPTWTGAYGNNDPRCLAIADFNGDGKPDIAAGANRFTHSILFGDGSGGFSQVYNFTGGSSAYGIAAADLNEDGELDLAAGNNYTSDISIYLNRTGPPAGLSQYGVGTFGCAGIMPMSANASPKINSPNFAFTCTNAPSQGLGLLLITDAPDVVGHDVFGIGILLHLDLFAATQIYSANIYGTAGGLGVAPEPIPNNPGIAGSSYYAQSVWFESTTNGQVCSLSPFHLMSTRGLHMVIQP